VEHWLETAQDLSRLEVIFSLHPDDDTLPRYATNIINHVKPWVKTLVLAEPHNNMNEGLNQAAAASKGDVLVSVFDDFEAPQFWDAEILRRLSGQPGKCLFVSDGFRSDRLQTMAIMTRQCYQDWGYVWYGAYPHVYSDNDYHEHAKLEDRVVEAFDLVFEHRHYLRTGAQPDRTYIEGNLPEKYALGRELLARRRACQFKE
jgi:hypothetical protein